MDGQAVAVAVAMIGLQAIIIPIILHQGKRITTVEKGVAELVGFNKGKASKNEH